MSTSSRNHSLRKGDFNLFRQEDHSSNSVQPKLFMVWEASNRRRGALSDTTPVIDASLVVRHCPSQDFLKTELGRRIRNARSADDAVSIFRHAIEPNLQNLFNALVDPYAKPLKDCIRPRGTLIQAPTAEAVRKVILVDTCPNRHCRNGILSATHRAKMYRECDFPTFALQSDRQNVPMQCPACLPAGLVLENEDQILAAFRLDSGEQVTSAELDALWQNERQINQGRCAAGYDKIKFCPEVLWRVDRPRSGWIARRPGTWLEETGLLS